MNRVHFDFQQAKAKHLQFKNRLRSILFGEVLVDETPVLSHVECPVGQWIYGHALDAYAGINEMKDLEQTHADLHTTARELVALYKSGAVDEARRGLERFETVAGKLVGLLHLVESKVNKTTEPDNPESLLAELLLRNERLEKTIREQTIVSDQALRSLHNFFMQAPAAFAILRGPEHVHEMVNPLMLEFVGKNDVQGKTLRQAFPEIESQGFYELLDNVYNTRETFVGKELPFSPDDGKGGKREMFIDFIYQAFVNEQNETEGILVFANDVTEQVTARKRLEESERRFRTFAEALPQLVWSAHPDGAYRFANQRWVEYSGLDPTAPDTWSQILHPDDADRVARVWSHSLKTGDPYETEMRLRSKSGEFRWFYVNGEAERNDAGEILSWVGAFTDIHERKTVAEALQEAEKNLRTLVDTFPQLAWMANPDGFNFWYNKGWYDYTGTTPKQMEGWGWQSVHDPHLLPSVMERWTHSLSTGEAFEMEFPLRGADGKLRWFLTRVNPLRDAQGNIVRWFGTNTDIHDKKNIEEQLERRVKERTQELQEANVQLQRSNSDLEQFAFVASHDLQEPLRKIRTFVERLREEQPAVNQKGQTYFNKIVDASDRMAGLIHDVLEYSRLSRSEEAFARTDLNDVLKNVLTDYELVVEQTNASVKADTLPVVDAVPLQMNQLFNNLLGNSLKFTAPDRTPELNIETRVPAATDIQRHGLDPRLRYSEIIFKDNGIGFNQEYAEQIFTIFNRLNGKTQYKGTGIGLALCRKIVTNHQGVIFANSVEGKGTVFHVVLPTGEI